MSGIIQPFRDFCEKPPRCFFLFCMEHMLIYTTMWVSATIGMGTSLYRAADRDQQVHKGTGAQRAVQKCGQKNGLDSH